MEVHQHSHSARKKWYHYLWEFFMLFLAVTAGFLVENMREHHTEVVREKEYIQSLVADIQEDTSEIRKSSISAIKAIKYEDSVIYFLYNNHPIDYLDTNFINLDFNALLRVKIVFNKGTAQQLKNSGNMRLIHDPELARQISLYWNEQENTQISLDRYLEYRNRGREFAEKLFVFSDLDLVRAGLIKPSGKGIRVIQSTPALWLEYTNILSHCHITIANYLDQIKKLSARAEELIQLLRKAYHLK